MRETLWWVYMSRQEWLDFNKHAADMAARFARSEAHFHRVVAGCERLLREHGRVRLNFAAHHFTKAIAHWRDRRRHECIVSRLSNERWTAPAGVASGETTESSDVA